MSIILSYFLITSSKTYSISVLKQCITLVIARDKCTTPQNVDNETKSYLLENRIVEQFVNEININVLESTKVKAENDVTVNLEQVKYHQYKKIIFCIYFGIIFKI